MHAIQAMPLLAALLLGSCRIQPIDMPVRLREGTTVDVPFSVTTTGTYDIQLQYPEDLVAGRIEEKLYRELAGSATLRAGNKKLEWQLPTSWFSKSPFDHTAAGMVLRRFHAYANTPYVLRLQITRFPHELNGAQGVVSVYRIGFKPHSHEVYELQ
jgi:hypothetical protein